MAPFEEMPLAIGAELRSLTPRPMFNARVEKGYERALAQGRGEEARMLIREVILENFMSHKYSRIPLGPGINVICGPNGAGKSSILLGISLALGQSHTERSKRLRDLIRWGEDFARITLILDNSPRDGRRPLPRVKRDYVVLTRVLRADGRYWFEIDGAAAPREAVRRLLAKLGVSPENMLIIMHQGMVERFAALDPKERLILMEEAAGLREFRARVLSARRKLAKALSEEKVVKELLENARQTLEYWREQYERYQVKKELLMRREFLERELAWARVAEREKDVSSLEGAVKAREDELASVEAEAEELKARIEELMGRVGELRAERRAKMREAVEAEGRSAKGRAFLSLADKLSEDGLHVLAETCSVEMGLEVADLSGLKSALARAIEEAEVRAKRAMGRAEELDVEIASLTDRLIGNRVRLEVLSIRGEQLRAELRDLRKDLKARRVRLNELKAKAEALGPRVPAPRAPEDVEDELRRVEGHIAALRDVGEEAELMYERYSKLYNELEKKAEEVRANREEAMGEVRRRMEAWRSVVGRMIEDVDARFRAILARMQGDGSVELVNTDDIEEAGVEIKVGFRKAKPVPLDAFVQSGGERSVATVAFLLALQQHVRSPFRAIDEYDVHLDPVNRQRLAEALVAAIEGSDAQYIVITPGALPFSGEDIRVITVQSVEGESVVKVLRP